MDREIILYRRFVDEVLTKMEHEEIITRAQIMYQLGITDYLTDKLLWYLKKNCIGYGFNKNSINEYDGYMIQFMKPNRNVTKMYIIKI